MAKLAEFASDTATSLMRSSSFHDLEKWERHRRDSFGSGNSDDDDAAEKKDRFEPASRTKTIKSLQAVDARLSNTTGTALSHSGVLAASAAGCVACHAVRLMIREVLEVTLASSRRSRTSASWRTFELYLLSLCHSAAWVAFGVKRLLQREGWSHDAGGSVRALSFSSGYHLYVLLTLRSVWTHPLVTLQQLAELAGISAQLRSVNTGWIVPYAGAVRCLPNFFLAALSALEHFDEPVASVPFRVLRRLAALSVMLCKGLITPLYLRAVLTTRPELHQPQMLPRKIATASDAALSVAWLASRLLLRPSASRAGGGAGSSLTPLPSSLVVRELRAALTRLGRHARVNATALLLTASLQVGYLTGPLSVVGLGVMLLRARHGATRAMRMLRAAVLAALGALVASAIALLRRS